MPSATITLDDDNGQIACKLVFSGGFDRTSNAHQHAQILLALMDQHMQRQGAPVIDPVMIETGAMPTLARTPVGAASRIILDGH
jgi:hypothetical protein